MFNESRTKNVAVNATIGLICQGIGLIMDFLNRTFLIKYLGIEYLGINGLFTNVLTILSFAELGIGQAIVYNLYRPLSENDTEKIKSLMKLYKNCYHAIALFIAIVGCCFIPFLKYIVKDASDINENLTLVYCLFLLSTVSSYFFLYKSSLLSAAQKQYKVTMYSQIVRFFGIMIQIFVLSITRNFILYLLIQISTGIFSNAVVAMKADSTFPYLKEPCEDIDKKERKSIFKNVRALVLYKFGSVVLNGTDNIIISAFVGISEVGLLSNYTVMSSALNTILGRITESFTASIGNLNTTNNSAHQYDVFKKILFMWSWLYGFATVALICLSNNILNVWLGTEYEISMMIILASSFHFYVNAVHYAAYSYRITLGYFVQGQFSPVAAAILNIILSLVFAQKWGTAGILFATSVSRIFTTGIVDPILIYKNTFYRNPIFYYIRYIAYAFVVGCVGLICYYINTMIVLSGILGLFVRCLVLTIVFNLLMFLVYFKQKEFKGILENLKTLVNKLNLKKYKNH